MTRANLGAGKRSSRGSELDQHRGGADHSSLVDRADDPADYTGWAKRWAWPLVAGAVVLFGMSAARIDLWRGLAVGFGATLLIWAAVATVMVKRVRWHDDVPGLTYHPSSSWEVSGMIGARESVNTFTEYLRPQLWSTAQALLVRRGIDPDSEQARQVVGAAPYSLLTGEQEPAGDLAAHVSSLAEVVARLAVDPGLPGRLPIDSPALAGLAGRHLSEGPHR